MVRTFGPKSFYNQNLWRCHRLIWGRAFGAPAMHLAKNRLLVFARKPTPVQVTYLAYCSTTGLDAIDYRITDSFIDPPETEVKADYSEESIRLPQTYWCYPPSIATPEITPSPVLKTDHITFGWSNVGFANWTKRQCGEAFSAVSPIWNRPSETS